MSEQFSAASAPPLPGEHSLPIDWGSADQWQCNSPDTIKGELTHVDLAHIAESPSLQLLFSGAGTLLCVPPAPICLPEDARGIQLWLYIDKAFDANHQPELFFNFGEESEVSLGILDFVGWHLLYCPIESLATRDFTSIAIKNLISPEQAQLVFNHLSLLPSSSGNLEEKTIDPPQIYTTKSQFMSPILEEEVSHDLRREDFSFILEARSLSSVIRFVYTPIEGTLADIELEINNGDPIKPAEDGGATIFMGGREWSSEDENIERHFVSCELVGDSIEARWQWKHGEESADFLYRFSLEGKSLAIDIEGGNGKATGVNLGHVTEALQPVLIRIPFFAFGAEIPQVLRTAGVFISSFVDWDISQASNLYAPVKPSQQHAFRLNGGCTYFSHTDGKRTPLRERIFITVSRQFEEVLPILPEPVSTKDPALLRSLTWLDITTLPPSEEAYIEVYELLLKFKEWGMDHIMASHPLDTWHDGDGVARPSYALEGSLAKGGDDALIEYLEALTDSGNKFALQVDPSSISPLSEEWHPDLTAVDEKQRFISSSPGQFLLKPTLASTMAPEHVTALVEKFHNRTITLTSYTQCPPWERIDCDDRLLKPASYQATVDAELATLKALAEQNCTVGLGGTHWFYRGLLHGHIVRPCGPKLSDQPLFVDFDLRHLHPFQTDIGLGSPEDFFGREIHSKDLHGQSLDFDRYLVATIAYGHACRLPDPQNWSWDAVVKAYYLMQKLQTYYLGVPVTSINYHHDGNLLETNDALLSGAYESNQLQIVYENGLRIWVNGNAQDSWTIERESQTFTLSPFSFFASGPEDFLAYSADTGSGRIDYVSCADYLYYDTRGAHLTLGPITMNGTALIMHRPWEIDVYPLACSGNIDVRATYLWPDRRMPKLRLLGFAPGETDPATLKAETSEEGVSFEQSENFYKYRITLPEWMVEPGR